NFPGDVVDVPFFIAEWIPQAKYTENVNGGSLAWNPPFFAGCYFTAPKNLGHVISLWTFQRR
ncbi:MAG: hypothetical protein PUH34_02060, partial [Eubacteriales bacterium]|nr:hypothetical protein [Eubacteriales bacterium]